MISFLKQPYPGRESEESSKRFLIKATLIGAFIFLFLSLFQPFNISLWSHPLKYFFLFIFGCITTFSMIFHYYTWYWLFPKFYREDGWTVLKQIVDELILMLFIAFLNLIFLAYLAKDNLSFMYFVYMFLAVLSIGFFPIMADVLLKYRKALGKYQGFERTKQEIKKSQNIEIIAENEKDKLSIASDKLYYISSADNYCEVVYQDQSHTKKELIRSSLTRVETQLKNTSLKRCHRSFIVNTDCVEKVSGNAQGFKLHLRGVQDLIPVARNYAGLVESLR